MSRLDDLVALESDELDSFEIHPFLGGRDGAHRRDEITRMRTLPCDLEHHGVSALGHLRDRSRRVGERFLPSLACLDDLIRTLDFALGRELFVHRVRAQRRLEPLPVSRAERFNALFRQAHLVCTHRGPPLLTLDSDWPSFLAERTPGVQNATVTSWVVQSGARRSRFR